MRRGSASASGSVPGGGECVAPRRRKSMVLFSGRASAFVVSLGARVSHEAGQIVCAVARRLRAVVGAAIALCLIHPAIAQQTTFVFPYSGTLKKINDSGVVRIGHRENSPPFAFVDPGGKPVGYALDLCDVVVEEIAAELGKDVTVTYRPVTPENRFDLLTSGEIDLECGSTTNNAERRKNVAFSPTMFVTGTKLLVRRDSGIRSMRDLQGKTVVLTRGTVQFETIPKLAERQKLAIKFVFASDHKESFQVLASGNADAFANDDVQLYGMLADTKTTAQYGVVGDFLTYADYALTLRKDDPEFAEIYEKWFLKPLPSGVRLNLKMSPHLEELFSVQDLPRD